MKECTCKYIFDYVVHRNSTLDICLCVIQSINAS